MSEISKLWTEKYRPSTLDGYVFQNEGQKEQIQAWVDAKDIPHLLFSGGAGIGKTTLAKILINAMNIDPFDLKEINASRDNSVEYIRETITGFVSTMPFGEFKVVLLDEADYLTLNAQAVLRNLMEKFADTAKFILTCNYPYKIIPALHSRCQGFHIDKIDHTEFTARIATVLVTENVEFDLDTLDSYVKATYPDLRKCLNSCQQNSLTGVLRTPTGSTASSADYKLAMVDLFKKGKVREARTLLCSNVQAEEINDVFRWMYDNLDIWSKTDQGQDAAIMIIKQGLLNHAVIADAEVNLAATLVELSQIES
jgi:replication factor C small subunit